MSYNKRVWANGDLITKERMNNMENGIYDAHDKINAINNKVEDNTTDTNTAIQDISGIKLQIGTEELTTTSKKIKGAINDLSSQIKETMKIRKLNNNTTTKTIAHRGFSSKAPENTIPAYIEASKAGFWGGECDVIQTVDLEYVLMHDDTLDRMTNGTGNVKDKTLSELKELIIDNGSNISEYPNLKIPTLDEFVSCCRANNLVPIIEVKWLSNYEHFIGKIKELGLEHDCVFICFSKGVNEYIRKKIPIAKIQQLYNVNQLNSSEINYCASNNFDIDCYYSDVSTDLIKECKSNNIELNCWTVNDANIANNLVDMNVDYISTDTFLNTKSIEYKINNKMNDISDINIDNTPYRKLVFASRFGGDLPFDDLWNVTNLKRCSCLSKTYIPNDIDKIQLSIPETLKLTLNFFDENDKFISDIGWLTNGFIYPLPNAKYFTSYWAKADDTEFSKNDLFDIYSTDITIKRLSYDWQILSIYNYQANGTGSHYNDSFVSVNDARAISKEKMAIKGSLTVNTYTPDGYQLTLIPYNKENIRLDDIGWLTNGETTLPNGTFYFIVYWRKSDNSAFTFEDKIKCKNESYIF